MGRASSNKKVARASRAAGRNGSSRNLAWPIGLGVVVVLGIVLVGLSAAGRQTAEASPPVLGDHWHAAYGLYICGDFEPPLADAQQDVSGLHSHSDGLIHIHPFSTRYTGDGANLGAFADTVGLELADDQLTLPSGDKFENGDDCDGEPGEVQVKVWDGIGDEQGRMLEADFADFAPSDGSLVTIAFAPEGAELPKPPSTGTAPQDVAGAAPVGGVPAEASTSTTAPTDATGITIPTERTPTSTTDTSAPDGGLTSTTAGT